MVSSAARTVEQYLADLPPERRAVVARVRDMVRRHVPAGYEESMLWGMICWSIPLARYPDTYNGQPLGYVALAAQKHFFALYLSLYTEPARLDAFRRDYEATGKKLDMGKSCLRFRTLDDLPLDLVGASIASTTPDEYIAIYERSRRSTAGGAKPATKQAATKKKTATKQTAATKAAATKAPAKQARGKAAARKATPKQGAKKAAKQAAKKPAR